MADLVCRPSPSAASLGEPTTDHRSSCHRWNGAATGPEAGDISPVWPAIFCIRAEGLNLCSLVSPPCFGELIISEGESLRFSSEGGVVVLSEGEVVCVLSEGVKVEDILYFNKQRNLVIFRTISYGRLHVTLVDPLQKMADGRLVESECPPP